MNGQSAAKVCKQKNMLVKDSVYNSVKVLEYAYSKGNKHYYNTECLVCGISSTRRKDHIQTNPNFCNHCKEKMTAKPKVESVINSLYSGYKGNAKSRNLTFNLTKEEFKKLISQNCFFCNQEPTESVSSKSRNRTTTKFVHNGIDRLNSKFGYVLENCVSCCGMCNLMKNKFSTEDFLNKVAQIFVYKQCSTTMPEGSTLQAYGSGNGRNPEMDCDIV
jgi:hypothetical protein